MRKLFLTLFLCFLSSGNADAQEGPIAPTEDVESTTKKTGVDPKQLPYKITTIEDLFIPDATETATDTSTGTNTATVKEIDWSKIPFIPFKLIELPPAGDPL